MPSQKPKLQGNVDAKLYTRFIQWKEERGFPSDSLALNGLIREFFGMPSTTAPPDVVVLEELVEKLLEKKLNPRIMELEAKIIEAMVEQRLGNLPSNPPVIQGDTQMTEDELDLMAGELTPTFVMTGQTSSELPSNPLPSETKKPKPISLSLTGLSGVELARRLDVNPATLIKNRGKSAFEEWSKAKDPQALAWRYAADIKRYELSLGGQS
jgi:hypothetical protein